MSTPLTTLTFKKFGKDLDTIVRIVTEQPHLLKGSGKWPTDGRVQ